MIRFEKLNSKVFERRLIHGVNESMFAAHWRKLCHPCTWATHIEVMATATYFQVPVYFCTQAPSGFYRWEVFKPLQIPNYQFKHPLLPFPEEILPALHIPRHFELSYTQKRHYDCVVSLENGEVCTTPPPLSGWTFTVDLLNATHSEFWVLNLYEFSHEECSSVIVISVSALILFCLHSLSGGSVQSIRSLFQSPLLKPYLFVVLISARSTIL